MAEITETSEVDEGPAPNLFTCTSKAVSGQPGKGTVIFAGPTVTAAGTAGCTQWAIKVVKRDAKELRLGVMIKSKYLALCAAKAQPGHSFYSSSGSTTDMVFWLNMTSTKSYLKNGGKTLGSVDGIGANTGDELVVEVNDATRTMSCWHKAQGTGGGKLLQLTNLPAGEDLHLTVQFFGEGDAVEVRCDSGDHLQATLGLDMRKDWQSTGKKGEDANKLFAVANGSPEFQAVSKAFQCTLSVTIDTVERIENGFQQEQYALQLAAVKKQCTMAWNQKRMQRLLFHGTEAVESIVNDPISGFKPLLAGTATGAMYGDGTYFARDAQYSDGYARILPSGQKQMLLVNVVVGQYIGGTNGMNICPLLPGEKYKRYNSLVDKPTNPSIFVVQHPSQAYPAYLVTYH